MIQSAVFHVVWITTLKFHLPHLIKLEQEQKIVHMNNQDK